MEKQKKARWQSVLLPNSEQIAAAYAAGSTVLELAEQWNVNRKAILKLFKHAGIQNRGLSTVTDATINEMILLHESGIHIRGISEQLNISYQIVLRKLRSKGIEVKLQKSAHSTTTRRAIVDAYLSGVSTHQMEKEMGIASCVLYNILLSENVPLRKQTLVEANEVNQIVSLYSTGLSLGAVGKRVGFSMSTVRNVLQRVGVKRRDTKETSARNWQNPNYAQAVNSKRIVLTGENHPGWKGGRTSLIKALRTCKEYENWRLAVFRRDNFVCQHCGTERNKKLNPLEADHIFPFSALLQRHKISDRQQAVNCPELWDINNGRTLCKSCHRQTDTYSNGAKKYLMKQ